MSLTPVHGVIYNNALYKSLCRLLTKERRMLGFYSILRSKV